MSSLYTFQFFFVSWRETQKNTYIEREGFVQKGAHHSFFFVQQMILLLYQNIQTWCGLNDAENMGDQAWGHMT